MNIITKTALSNFKRNKSRNILIGIAIALTSFLLTVIPTLVVGLTSIEFEAVNRVYPSCHGMFRNIKEDTAKKLIKDADMESFGFREDLAYMPCKKSDVTIVMICMDKEAIKLSKMKLQKGNFPKNADEIVVSKSLLEAMGLKGSIGSRIMVPFQPIIEKGRGKEEKRKFTISGILSDPKDEEGEKYYTAFVSNAFVKEIIPAGMHKYRIYFRLKNTEGMVTDAISDKMKEIGERYGIKEDNLVENSDYLLANYVDPALYQGMAIIIMAVMLAGILTIYSIYYVSMIHKVQEYGQIRAVGATKRQIKNIVLCEGFAVATFAIPPGIIIGLFFSRIFLGKMMHFGVGLGNLLAEQMDQILKNHEVGLVKPWIILLAVAVSFVTVYLSLFRPMQIAGKVSAIEAIRYRARNKMKKKSRKGYESISIKKLTAVNLGRNKKRTIATIVTLGMTGILFITAATVCSCMNPADRARDDIRGDINVSIDSWEEDKMHPERSLGEIQKNNPLSKEFQKALLGIDGVEGLETRDYVRAGIKELREEDGSPLKVGIDGIGDGCLKELEPYVVEGTLSDSSFTDGSGIIIQESRMGLWPEEELRLGKIIEMKIYDGSSTLQKSFQIAAIVNAPLCIGGYLFSMPQKELRSFCKVDTTDRLDLTVQRGKEMEVEKKIKEHTDGQKLLKVNTYRQTYETTKREIGFMVYGCYGILFIFGLIGILNLINTMINSAFVRKKELGMLQAIGMSEKQMLKMLQLEGLFYTVGTMFLSIGTGSILGYFVFQWARENDFMSIRTYHYPAVPAITLTFSVFAVQLLVTFLVNKSFKKQSLIERIRFSE